jgi:hypothetical protein
MKAKFKTTDNKNYHQKFGTEKTNIIKDYVSKLSDVKKVYDVGCNNGKVSYPLQIELNLDVLGTDLSNDLECPKDYNIIYQNIAESNHVYFNDLTLFLSLYHHILGAYDLKTADEVFIKLFLRTKYLIFDTGNLSEINRNNQYWYDAQKKYFKNEDELLKHFNLPYDVIGSWKYGGGIRKVVVFKNENTCFNIIENFISLKGSKNQEYGLKKSNDVFEEIKHGENVKPIIYSKLKWNDKVFFSKKRIEGYEGFELENKEIKNIEIIYNNFNQKKLLNFYGYNKNYGLIYEWIENIKYKGKTKLLINEISLTDVNEFEIDGEIKLSDFDS